MWHWPFMSVLLIENIFVFVEDEHCVIYIVSYIPGHNGNTPEGPTDIIWCNIYTAHVDYQGGQGHRSGDICSLRCTWRLCCSKGSPKKRGIQLYSQLVTRIIFARIVQPLRKKYFVTDEMVLPFQPVSCQYPMISVVTIYPNRCPSLKYQR